MPKSLTLKHSIFAGLSFTFKNFDDSTKLTTVYSEIEKMFESNGVSPKDRFTLATFRRAVKDMRPIKTYWQLSIVDQALSAAQESTRKAMKRDEERKAKKMHKKATRMAKRSMTNGNRNFLHSAGTKKGPKIKPSAIALAVHKLVNC